MSAEPRDDDERTAPADLSGLEGLIDGPVRVLRFEHEAPGDDDEPVGAEASGALTAEGGDDETGGGSDDEADAPWSVDVVVIDSSPARGFTTYATSGLRRLPGNVTTDDGREIRTEFVMVARTPYRAAADVLDACAEAVASGTVHLVPGTVLPEAVERVDPGHACRHVVLVPPFLWPELEVLSDDPDGEVLARLQAVPVTTPELRAIARDGADAVFAALESARADVTDPDRSSVV